MRGWGGGTGLEYRLVRCAGCEYTWCVLWSLLRAWRPLCHTHLQMLSFMHAQYSFFQQGYSLLHQLDPYMKKLAAEVSLRAGVGPKTRLSG